MSEFTETIKVVVQSVFNSDGFDKLERRMANLMNTRDNLEKQFDRGVGMKNINSEISQIEDKFTEAGLEIQTFSDQVSEVEKKVSDASKQAEMSGLGSVPGGRDDGSSAEFETKGFTNSIDEMFDAADEANLADQIVDNSMIDKNVKVAKDQLQELGFVIQDMETGMPVMPGEFVDRLADADDRIQKFGGLESELPSSRASEGTRTLRDMERGPMQLPEIRPLGTALRNTMATANVAGLQAVTGAMGDVGDSANTATTGVQRFSQNSLPEMDRSIGQVAQSTRGLQMRLLGLQFTMLTVAFIFGGVMASALGAVGAFQILGNTLKFLFLPTALDLLDPLLNLQDFVFGLDEETRRFIGTVFGAISVISIAIGLFAALAQPIVGLIGTLLRLSSAFNILSKLGSSIVFLSRFGQTAAGLSGILSTVGGSIGTLLTFFSSAGATASGFSGILGVLGGSLSGLLPGIMAVGSALLSLAGPILAIIGILVGLFVVFKRFPGLANGIVKAVTGAFDFLFKYLKMVINSIVSIFKGLFNILTGLFTAGLALITGDFEKAFRGLQEVLFGLGQVFVEPFENALNFIGNTIIPAFGDTGETILKTLANAILSNGSALINALISVLPDSLQGIARDKFQSAKTDVEKFLDKNIEAVGRVGDGFEEFNFKVGKDFKKKDTKSKAKKEKDSGNGFTVENLNTSLNVNKGNESPRETSRKAGRELRRGMVNKGSNFATGT